MGTNKFTWNLNYGRYLKSRENLMVDSRDWSESQSNLILNKERWSNADWSFCSLFKHTTTKPFWWAQARLWKEKLLYKYSVQHPLRIVYFFCILRTSCIFNVILSHSWSNCKRSCWFQERHGPQYYRTQRHHKSRCHGNHGPQELGCWRGILQVSNLSSSLLRGPSIGFVNCINNSNNSILL